MVTYEKYKDSGIEWVGRIPGHWEVVRVKDFTTKVGSGVTPRGGAEAYLDEGIPLFRSQNVHNDGFLLDDIAFISPEIDEQMSGSRVKAGDVLLNITGASIGRCYYTDENFQGGNVNQHVCIIRTRKEQVKPNFFHYYMISDCGQNFIKFSQTGGNREGLTIEEIRGMSLPLPPLAEQVGIAGWLDERTGEIEGRIAVLERMARAYGRLRAAVVNRAVTRGLDKKAELRDSGVQWIGNIPKHWKVKRMKDVCQLNPNFTGDDISAEVDFLPMEGLRYDKIATQTIPFAEGRQKYTYFGEDDLLVAKVTPCFENLNIAIAKGLKYGVGFGSSEFFVLRTDKEILLNRFMFYLVCSHPFQGKACATMCGVGGLKRISPLFMKTHQIALPPLSEQREIAEYLDGECRRIDAVVKNINRRIEAYRRLKRALINECVTGRRRVWESKHFETPT